MAALAPAVLCCAEQGDPAAREIRATAVPALVDSLQSVVAQARLRGTYDIVLAGAPRARCVTHRTCRLHRERQSTAPSSTEQLLASQASPAGQPADSSLVAQAMISSWLVLPAPGVSRTGLVGCRERGGAPQYAALTLHCAAACWPVSGSGHPAERCGSSHDIVLAGALRARCVTQAAAVWPVPEGYELPESCWTSATCPAEYRASTQCWKHVQCLVC